MFTSIVLVTAASTSILYAFYLLIQPKRGHLLVTALILGAVAFGIAFAIQDVLLTEHILTLKQINLFSAPLLEELLKAALLVVFIMRIKTIQPGEGAFYGFAIGVSFAILESAAYILSDPSQALNVAAARSVSVNLMHGIGIALAGYGMVMCRQGRLSIMPTFVLVGAAVVIHAASNFLTNEVGVYGAASAIGLSIAGIMFLALLSKTAIRPLTNSAPVQSS
jgi:RsiW-degrading membrane proteinase PrsW (M82 family)